MNTTENQQLEAAQQQAIHILETITDGFCTLDREWRFTYINSQLEKILQKSRAELLGKNIWEVYPDAVGSTFYQKYYEAFITNIPIEFEEFCPYLNIWIETKVYPSEQGLTIYGRDITNRKQIEQELTTSEKSKDELLALLDTSLTNAPVGFAFYDGELRFLRVNNCMAEINGISVEEHIGRTVGEILPPDIALTVETILRSVRDTKQPVLNIEITGQTKASPQQRYWLANYYPVQAATGEMVGVGVAVLEITQLKQTQKALAESETRFRRLVESNVIGIIVASSDRITEANDVFLEMVGYTREDLASGKLIWQQMTPPEYQELDNYGVQQLLTTGVMTPFEKEYIRKDGSRVSVLLGGATWRSSPMSAICFVFDLSERQRSQQELRESEERLRMSLEAGQMGIWDWNILTNEIKWSDNLEEIHGMRKGSFAGTFEAFQQIIHPEDRQFVLEAISSAVNGCGSYDIEFRIIWADGSIHWMSGKGQSFCNATGKAVRMIGVGMDVTVRKQVEETLRRQSEELERANRVKDEFLAVLSHELRSPLNAILGWAKLLLTRKFDETTTTRAIETIERNAQLQTQLIEDLLDVSRILRGKISLNICPVDLVSTIASSIDTMTLAASAKSIEIQTNLDPLVGLVSGDPNRLQQIIWNLLSNAIKFTPDGGCVEIILSCDRNEAQIQVKDTGKGISADFLPYVFDYFRQADGSITRTHGGLGLGLAIVRQLVELHGGTVQAESPGLGQGATFTVNLPLLNRQIATTTNSQHNVIDAATATQNQATTQTLANLNILVVDDEADTRDFYITVLEELGADITAVTSVQEALEVIKHRELDILVSDIGMPDEDGYSLIRKLRAWEAPIGKQIPAIALTAYARDEDRKKALNAGFQRHLSKPVEPDDLLKAIFSLANKEELGD